MNTQPAAGYFASGAAPKAKNERAARACVGADEVKRFDDPHVFVYIYLQTGTYYRVTQDVTIDAAIRAQIAERFRAEVEAKISSEGDIVTTTRWTAFVACEPRG